MDDVNAMLDGIYEGREVLSRDQMYEDVVAAAAPEPVIAAVAAMPDGMYRKQDVLDALTKLRSQTPARPPGEFVARTGAEQPWDPEDLAVAKGRDPTPANIERARRELAKDGAAAIERTVP